MFRVLEDINAKNADAMHTAGEAMKVGMGVVKVAGKKVEFPAAATASDVFFVTKEVCPTGIDMLKGNISDYDFEDVANGTPVVLVKPVIGEIYWTDQTDTVAVGDYLVVGTDGLFEAASATATSNLKVISITEKDAGTHAGVSIEVVDWATVTSSEASSD